MTVYTRAIAQANAALTKWGETITYARTGEATRDANGDYSNGTDLSSVTKIIWHDEKAGSLRAMMNVKDQTAVQGSRLLLMAATTWAETSAAVEPLVGDTVTLAGGKLGTVKFADVLAPGSEVILWYVWVEII